jgi:hypothetical protein
MKRLLLTLFSITLLTGGLVAQNTIGLLSYKPAKAFHGFNLIYPHNQPNVYLFNNCGEIVHVWEDDAGFRPGNTAYILDDGRLVKTKRPAAVAMDPIWAGGGGAIVEIRDWDNNLLWDFEMNNEEERLHHDIAVMSNGNILMIAWEVKTEAEAIQAGRDPALLPDGELWPDYVLEVNPTTDEIVWEWHVWDHLIQDFDATKDNFGVVEDHPGRIDINYDTSDGADDWLHTNAIDYNEELDLIMLSVPTFNEIWIIDHSTTTQEAAGSTGGNGKRGGELMYRYGNPAAYQSGTEDDQKLFYQHDPNWIDDFVEFGDPNYGRIAVFNNRVTDEESNVHILNPVFDMYDWEYPMDGDTWGPESFDFTYAHPQPERMHSTGLSGVQFLPNGNALISAGRTGYAFEITPDEEIVWEYVTPLIVGSPATQGDSLILNQNLTFRVKRYPADFAAFDGKDLSGQGYLELEPNTDFCQTILASVEEIPANTLTLFPNPTNSTLTIEWEGGMEVDIEVFTLTGQPVNRWRATGGRKYCDLSNWSPGVYLVRINQSEVRRLIVTK